MNIERARVLSKAGNLYASHCCPERNPQEAMKMLMDASDAYALSAHVDECAVYTVDKYRKDCGDDWYCEKAQTYMFPVTDREDSA